MPDGATTGTAGKTSVGYQGHITVHTQSAQGAGRGQHFSHARPAFRSLITDDNDVAFLDPVAQYRRHRFFLALKNPRRSDMAQHIRDHANLLYDSAVGGQCPLQHC